MLMIFEHIVQDLFDILSDSDAGHVELEDVDTDVLMCSVRN